MEGLMPLTFSSLPVSACNIFEVLPKDSSSLRASPAL